MLSSSAPSLRAHCYFPPLTTGRWSGARLSPSSGTLGPAEGSFHRLRCLAVTMPLRQDTCLPVSSWACAFPSADTGVELRACEHTREPPSRPPTAACRSTPTSHARTLPQFPRSHASTGHPPRLCFGRSPEREAQFRPALYPMSPSRDW